MRDQTPDNTSKPNVNIIVNLHPTDATHWVLVIRREGGPVYYFDSFSVETPPLILEEYVDLGSNERIKQYDESYCGAYYLYMIYLIDSRFRINNALNTPVNQCKYPGIYNECFCSGCSKDLRSSFVIMIMLMIILMIMIMLMIMLMIMIMIMLKIMLMVKIMLKIKILIMLMIMIMLMIKIMLMIMLMTMIMIYEVDLLIMLIIMIMLMIFLYIYLMKNIKGVILTTILVTISP